MVDTEYADSLSNTIHGQLILNAVKSRAEGTLVKSLTKTETSLMFRSARFAGTEIKQ